MFNHKNLCKFATVLTKKQDYEHVRITKKRNRIDC